MRIQILTTLAVLAPLAPAAAIDPHPVSYNRLELWYRQPAAEWEEALPVGNGRLGAMDYGGAAREQIQINENTVWTGGGPTPIPDGVYKIIPEIRSLLFQGDFAQAEALVKSKVLIGKADGNSYQTLGDIFLTEPASGEPSDLRRSLDLDTGIATTRYILDGVAREREVFSSAPDQVIVVHLHADSPARNNLAVEWKRADSEYSTLGSDTLVVARTTWGVKFFAALRAVTEGGSVALQGNSLTITNAGDVTLLIAVATDYNRTNPLQPLTGDLRAQCLERLASAARRIAPSNPADALKARSIAEHQRLFRRMTLELGRELEPDLPTDLRLQAFQRGTNDLRLETLYFQYARYLLISASRPGNLPSNLQGIWNKDPWAPWGADYHININIQMDYWPAEAGNLSECHEPFFHFLETYAAVSGRKAARDFYGARGFVGHYTTDAWMYFPSGGQAKWALWQMGGAWCTRHFIEHYWYTGDRAFLKDRAYPMLRDASLFLLDWLVPDPKTGRLVSGPSASPENEFIGPDGEKHSVSMGGSMDQEIAWDTFRNFLTAAHELGIEDDLTRQVQSALDKLAWPAIAPDGRIQEWARPYDEPEPGHRHVSHLFGLHPGDQFNAAVTPEYLAAARKTLDYRLAHGGGHTGWSRAWIINFWARLHDGQNAHDNLVALLQKSTLPNLFDNHPPFQIDGNFGGAAGMMEMLVQSQQRVEGRASKVESRVLELLPALPAAWSVGWVNGLRARGGFEIDLHWDEGRLTSGRIHSLLGNPCRVVFNGRTQDLQTEAGRDYVLENGTFVVRR
ncbi:MAG: glycoside hydrolase family 95 protein [Verrucomicrobiota bacterium]